MKHYAIIGLWIIHFSGLIGIALGYDAFFLPKSPWTLTLIGVIMVCFYPIRSYKAILFATLYAGVAIGAEWIGVHTGLLFGDYHYGVNLGSQIDGIPLLIGVNWVVLTLATRAIIRGWTTHPLIIISLGALLMVIMDLFLEQICDYAGFWHFDGGQAGWYNYLCWYLLALIFHVTAHALHIHGDEKLSWHVYVSQLTFAAGLWLIIAMT